MAQADPAFITDYFDERTVREAVGGCCSEFALALHARTGWPLACLWTDPIIDEHTIFRDPSPTHAFCVAPDGRAVDAEGVAPFAELVERYRADAWGRPLRIEVLGGRDSYLDAMDAVRAVSMWPSEMRLEGAERVIRGSPAFLALVEELGRDRGRERDDRAI